jgi:hypothetical protein
MSLIQSMADLYLLLKLVISSPTTVVGVLEEPYSASPLSGVALPARQATQDEHGSNLNFLRNPQILRLFDIRISNF